MLTLTSLAAAWPAEPRSGEPNSIQPAVSKPKSRQMVAPGWRVTWGDAPRIEGRLVRAEVGWNASTTGSFPWLNLSYPPETSRKVRQACETPDRRFRLLTCTHQ